MIKLVIDSTAGMERAQAENYGISVVPLKILFSDGDYFEGYPDNFSFFYDKIKETGEFPKTSLPAPETFAGIFAELTKGGDEVICITLSSALSGTYNSALTAAADFAGKVSVIDSKNCCQNIIILAEEAMEMMQKGMNREQIVERLKDLRGSLSMQFVPETLEYLKKGGRIGLLSASLGSILKIKPLLLFKEGVLTNTKKVIGMSKAVNELVKNISQTAKKIYVCKIGSSIFFDTLLEKVKERFKNITVKIGEISPVIGAHVGPGALGVASL